MPRGKSPRGRASSRPRRGKNPYAQADSFTRAAHAAGYAARSVFKLQEIDRRTGLLRRGQHVLDLGAAPGSWSAYAAQAVGPSGRVVAVDLVPLRQALPANAVVIEGDAFDEQLLATGPVHDFAPYDVVLSDMAPRTTGDKGTDKARSFELFTRATALAERLLKPGGSFVAKLFMGPDFVSARDMLRERFAKVRTMRPEAVRDVSYEVFLVATGWRGSTSRCSSEG
jgi:23S rRNA (uridine2552-2'-O)-methyltransferase